MTDNSPYFVTFQTVRKSDIKRPRYSLSDFRLDFFAELWSVCLVWIIIVHGRRALRTQHNARKLSSAEKRGDELWAPPSGKSQHQVRTGAENVMSAVQFGGPLF